VKRLFIIFLRHHAKLWVLTTGLLVVIAVAMAASPRLMPGQYEYKTVIFKTEFAQPTDELTRVFDSTLNRMSTQNWEFVGPCCQLRTDHLGVDYIVFRRRLR
jgi:hypothetical protein